MLIVLSAAFIACRSAYLENALNRHVEGELIKLLSSNHETPDEIKKFAINPAIESTLVKTVNLINKNINPPSDHLLIFVKNKDKNRNQTNNDPWTHLAMIETNSKAIIEFRVFCESVLDQVYISGINAQGF
mgnify:CR=1 FL=1